MYTDKELDDAVNAGIFSADSVSAFRNNSNHTRRFTVDEERFSLIAGFNDVFVAISCALLLASIFLASLGVLSKAGFIAFCLIAWLLSEYFVRVRRMALPAIVLSLAFVGGVFKLFSFLLADSLYQVMIASSASAVAAYLYWERFRVPIVVAAAGGSVVMFILTMAEMLTVNSLYGYRTHFLALVMFLSGMASFAFAMIMDASDRFRVTYRSDVAFWLHLLSAPLIVYPIVDSLGVLDSINDPWVQLLGVERVYAMIFVLIMYAALIFISIVVDRRAFIVSSMFYVLIALGELLRPNNYLESGLFLASICVSLLLLMISAFWSSIRRRVVKLLPYWVASVVPPVGFNSLP